MGIDIHWENERGETLAIFSDSNFLIQRFLPSFDAREFPFLRCIDPYGDTTFNQLQIPEVISELERISLKRHATAVDQHLKDVLAFIRQAEGKCHTYIKFYGD
jgi:hypothetical protein